LNGKPMSIHFTCPHCTAQQSLSHDQAGCVTPCPLCGATITVPEHSDRAVVQQQTKRFRESFEREQTKIQFGLKQLLIAVTAFCLLFAMTASMGIGGVVLFSVVAIAMSIYWHNGTLLALSLTMGLLAACLLPAFQQPELGHPPPVCQTHLRQLVLAMHQYNGVYGTLPPAYLADASGKPMHSWRVLLLPYLGPDALKLYKQYDFNEPWDGPHNRLLAKHMPKFFACPQDKRRGKFDTSYVVVTGKETVFNADQSMSLNQLAAMDGTSTTLLVVECAQSGIHWMEPRDLRYDEMSLKINDPSGKQGVRGHHGDGANVGMADATCKFVSKHVNPAAWRAAFTANGGEESFSF
jgi:hypothetical protein